MKIAIDCRYLGLSGIGRYLVGILENLPQEHQYLFYGDETKIRNFGLKGEIVDTKLSPFSPKALFSSVKEINKCDCFFTPNFIFPFGIKTKIYATIHDVIFLDDRETTNGYLDYRIKKYLLKRATKKSATIFTVSNFSKNRILHHFPKTKNIVITYTGLSKNVLAAKDYAKITKENYVVFVGNLKKNKNIITLLKAFAIAREKDSTLKLFIVGSNNHKTNDEELGKYLNTPGVEFTGRIDDADLFRLISQAKYLVQPSIYEGFGLPPLEAMYLGTVPIISSIEVFKEIYSAYPVVFFTDINDLALKLLQEPGAISSDFNTQYTFKEVVNRIFSTLGGEK